MFEMADYCSCCGRYAPENENVCKKTRIIHGTDKKSALCIYLKEHHKGKANAIHSQDLQRLFSIDGRNLRRKISNLRQDGIPICSDEAGYYYADNQREINKTVCRLNGMVTGVSNARTGLLFAQLLPAALNVDITICLEGGDVE